MGGRLSTRPWAFSCSMGTGHLGSGEEPDALLVVLHDPHAECGGNIGLSSAAFYRRACMRVSVVLCMAELVLAS